ncbi:MAG TPA: signal peptidase II [Nocardioides sp.]|uniref:signal peptidase II n=1 Tax=Nocardioides sp. TaxID=35761 RepID=UPI002F410290
MQATRGTSLSSTDPAEHPTTPSTRHRLLFVLVALAAYAVDLGTKLLAVAHLDPNDPVEVVGDLLRLDLVRNPGAAFSTGTSYTLILTAIAVIAAGVVIRFGRRLGDRIWAIALGMLLAGVCGNLTDRIFREPSFLRGHVVDFLELPHWPVFNVADMLIDAAVVLIIIQTWRGIGITGARHSRS